MPVYQYDEGGGRIVERVLPVDERDSFPGRLVVPVRVSVCPRGEPSQEEAVLRGFYREESRPGGAAALHRTMHGLGLSPDGVKRVWSKDWKVREE